MGSFLSSLTQEPRAEPAGAHKPHVPGRYPEQPNSCLWLELLKSQTIWNLTHSLGHTHLADSDISAPGPGALGFNSFIEAAHLHNAEKIPPSSHSHLDQGTLFTTESERGLRGQSWSGEANKGQTGVMEGTEGLEEEGEAGDPVGMYWAGREEKVHHPSAMQGKCPGKGDSGKKCPNAVSI